MNTKQSKSYLASLHLAQDKFQQEVQQLAEKIRTEIIVPVCQKYHLTFLSGMGTFFFTDTTGCIYSDECLPPLGSPRVHNAIKPILFFLNEEVSHNQCLGYYIDDVR